MHSSEQRLAITRFEIWTINMAKHIHANNTNEDSTIDQELRSISSDLNYNFFEKADRNEEEKYIEGLVELYLL